MKYTRQQIGKWGEQAASQFLRAQGLVIIAQNVRTPYGEIDLIGQKDNVLIFIEVKARTTADYGYPEQAVNPKKQSHLIDAVASYLQTHPEIQSDWRIDVVAIQGRPEADTMKIEWFENAIQ
jgi:putative endonuclease